MDGGEAVQRDGVEAGAAEAAALFYHGGNLAVARRLYPDAPAPWIDLSTGINPVPYPVPTIAAEAWARLPEDDALAGLVATAAEAYGASDPATIAAAPGTQALIQWLPRLFPASEVAVLAPTYGEHARCWAAAGAQVRCVSSLDEVGPAGTVVVVNPNNPDGRLLPPERLSQVAADCRGKGGRLVVDEAFMDVLAPGASLVPERPGGAIVLRSFGKFYGLAGLRLGFAIASPDDAALIRDALGPWALSGPALSVGRAALADRDWQRRTLLRLAADAARLDDLLACAGMTIRGGTSLFRDITVPDAHDCFRRLAAAGVLVRAFAGQPTRLRVGLPSPDRWERLTRRLTALGAMTSSPTPSLGA